MLTSVLSVKWIILFIFILAVTYTQFRGKVRLPFLRQLINHSTFMAPINAIMYLFSAVPNKPFFDRKDFPALSHLRNHWQIMRDEAQQLVAQGYIRAAEHHDDMGFNSFFKRGWKRFYLKWYDNCLPSAEQLCPKTVAILKETPGLNGAMFALLPKKGKLNPHRDPYAGSIRYHLGLITPNSDQCQIYVDGIAYTWKDGEDVLFDETFIHHAKNNTDQDRIILLCDIERPMRNRLGTLINRFFNKYVLSESATKNLDSDRVGIFNKIFRQYNALAVVATKIKQSNYKLYKLLQYSLILGLGYLFFFCM